MFVIDIFKTSRLGELGVKKQTFEAQIIAVGFFVLDDQTEELRVGEIGGRGMGDLVAEASGHAEEFQSVESLKGLFVEHRRFSFLILVIVKLGMVSPLPPWRACVNEALNAWLFSTVL